MDKEDLLPFLRAPFINFHHPKLDYQCQQRYLKFSYFPLLSLDSSFLMTSIPSSTEWKRLPEFWRPSRQAEHQGDNPKPPFHREKASVAE